jgi:hypothetical protein
MSDGGVVTTEVNGWTVTSNSGGSEEQLRANLKPKTDAAVSQAAKELGKRGGEAAAKARSEKPEAEPAEKVEAKATEPAAKEPEAEEEPAKEAKAEGEEEKPEEKAEPEEKPEEKKPNPRHDPKARMLEATRKEAEAKRALAEERRRADDLEARLARLERGERPEAKTEPKPAEQDPDVAPELKKYVAEAETYEEGLQNYIQARDDWRDRMMSKRAEQEHAARVRYDAEEKFRQAAAPIQERFSEEVLQLKTVYQALEAGEPVSGANFVATEFVLSPETAPALMLHFSEHPDDLQRIAALSNPRAVSREMAKLEARLEAATAGNGSRRDDDVSRAAPPVRPVSGKPYVTDATEYRPGMSLDEYAKVWSKSQKR